MKQTNTKRTAAKTHITNKERKFILIHFTAKPPKFSHPILKHQFNTTSTCRLHRGLPIRAAIFRSAVAPPTVTFFAYRNRRELFQPKTENRGRRGECRLNLIYRVIINDCSQLGFENK